jgi:hypothetical protein
MRSTNCTSSFPDDYQTLFRLYTKLLAHSKEVAGRDVVDMMAPLKAYSSDETKNISLNGSSLFDMLVKQLTALEQSVLERKVTVETQELIPLQNTNKAMLSDKKKAKSK